MTESRFDSNNGQVTTVTRGPHNTYELFGKDDEVLVAEEVPLK
jgi:hypothetical protein